MKTVALTGIKPTGMPHLGNYLGMIRPALELVDDFQALFFIADYHALITEKNSRKLRRQIYETAATWLALGLDPRKVVFFRQSAIPEIFELAWVLSCYTAKGLLNRSHAYKAAVAANREKKHHPDMDINAGLFSYPVLMAADILLFGTRVVPVGIDQKQHVEIARDIAAAVNQTSGRLFPLPDPMIRNDVMAIPGLDGRKMSKTYANTIPIFAAKDLLRKQVMGIVTDSKRPEEPKNPDICTVFSIYKHFAAPESLESAHRGYTKRGLAYSTLKKELLAALEDRFGPLRATYRNLLETPGRIDGILAAGAAEARIIAQPVIENVRRTIGIGR